MDLNTLSTNLRAQAAANSIIVLDGSVFPATILDELRTAFALSSGTNLTIKGIKPTDIPNPAANGVLEISAGAATVLNQTGVKIGLSFTVAGGTLQALVVATMSSSWKFSDSFKHLDVFPFPQLKTSHPRFVFATAAQPAYAWPEDSAHTINLHKGLNFLSLVTLGNFPGIGKLLGKVLDNISFKFYGKFAPTAGQQLPVGTLRAPLGTSTFSVGVPPNALSLSDPAVAVRIGVATETNPLQPIDMLVDAVFQNALQVEVAIPETGGTLGISTTPLPNQSSVNSLIESLPGGQSFTSYIPGELSRIFANVGLNCFSMVVDPTPKVTYRSLAISTLQTWTVIPDVLVLENLALQIQTVEPTGMNWTRAYVEAKAQFLPKVFDGEFAFTVTLEKRTAWEVGTVSGVYYGAVTLGKIVAGVLGQQDFVPSVLRDIQFSGFSVNATRKESDSPFTYSFYGSVDTGFPILDRKLTSHLSLAVNKTQTGHTLSLTGGIVIGEEVFQITLDLGTPDSKLTARWEKTGAPLDFKDIAGAFGWDSMPQLPESLDLALADAEFIYDFTARTVALSGHSAHYGQILFASMLTPADSPNPGQRIYLFSLDLPLNVELSRLPLVGDKLPSKAHLGMKDLQIIVASSELAESDLSALNKLITDVLKGAPLIPASLAKGLTFASKIQMGTGSRAVVVPLRRTDSSSTSPPRALVAADATAADSLNPPQLAAATGQAITPCYQADAKWLNLQKTFGPVYFDKIGVQYQDAKLWFLLNASLLAAGLTISLDGLSVGSPLRSFHPRFNLHGLGIDFQGGPVEIGGAFLRIEKDGQPDQYDGIAIIKTANATISALGSYAQRDGHPSLFIYVFLNYPLGGPPFFFVTGLAAGFGYNRKLIAPSIDKVAEFPLVKQATGTAAAPGNLSDALQALHDYVPPAIGEIFLAVGVKFNSFKLIDSFGLITIQFGGHFVANVMGLSTAIIPTPEAGKSVTPLAEVQIAWKASFDPADGFLGIDARLTPNSYILARDCRLTGGYAFYSWFSGEHAGDFVQTLGGYHPSFAVPAHYPVVPRLGYVWQVSSKLTIKGDAYYALTGSALMAGGHLELLFHTGDLKAWLKVGADFLISWKPYHYDASIYVNVGVTYSFDINLLFGHVRVTISVDVGTDLHLWGPDFSGTAHIHLWCISFSISFGASASEEPQAIDWNTFQTSFLPAAEKVCSLSVKDGLVRTMKEDVGDRWIINPKHFSLVVTSAIPFKSGQNQGKELITNANTDFGIGSMEVTPADLHSTILISIKRDRTPADEEFKFTTVQKRIPAGLWGESLLPDLNGNRFIENVPTGFEITPTKSPQPGETAKIHLSQFQYTNSYFPKGEAEGSAYSWESSATFVNLSGPGREAVSQSVENNPQRPALLAALKVDVDVTVTKAVAGDFLSAPSAGTFSG